MKAIQFNSYGGPEVLQLVEIAAPEPGAGEIVIEVAAASVNGWDWKVRRGYMAQLMPLDFPAGMGIDAAGTVIAAGDGVTDVSVGDRVFGVGRDTYAEQAVLTSWAAVPDGVASEEVAGWGSAVQTAVRILDEIHLAAGQTVLVSGASGGVGSAAVQLAVARGLSVIGTASAANQDYLSSLGATPVVYGDGLVERVQAVAPQGVDAALDISGAGVIGDLITIVGEPSQVVSIADFSAEQQGARTSSSGNEPVKAFSEALAVPGFSIPVERRYPLAEAGAAQEQNAAGHARGKTILLPR